MCIRDRYNTLVDQQKAQVTNLSSLEKAEGYLLSLIHIQMCIRDSHCNKDEHCETIGKILSEKGSKQVGTLSQETEDVYKRQAMIIFPFNIFKYTLTSLIVFFIYKRIRVVLKGY